MNRPITRNDLRTIGRIYKTHGIKGEVSAALDTDPASLRCIVLEIDGIFVPFFIESARPRGTESWLIKLEGIDDETAASSLVAHDIYGITEEMPVTPADDPDEVVLEDLMGFELFDNTTPIGVIEDIDDSTDNILFIVKNAVGDMIYVPFSDELLIDYDLGKRYISMNLPDGLLDLN